MSATASKPAARLTPRLSGSAIYIYIIQSNYPTTTQLVSSTYCNFTIDGELVGNYSHLTDGTLVNQYNVLAYNNTSLQDANHTFMIETTGDFYSYLIFDYAVYTFVSIACYRLSTMLTYIASRTNVTSTKSVGSSIPTSHPLTPAKGKPRIGAIAGGVICGIMIIVPVAIIYYTLRRRSRLPNFPISSADLHNVIPRPWTPGDRSSGVTTSESAMDRGAGTEQRSRRLEMRSWRIDDECYTSADHSPWILHHGSPQTRPSIIEPERPFLRSSKGKNSSQTVYLDVPLLAPPSESNVFSEPPPSYSS